MIGSFFDKRLRSLEDFLVSPDQAVLRVLVEAEMERVPLNFLVRKEEEPDFPHLLIALTQDYRGWETWYSEAIDGLKTQIETQVPELKDILFHRDTEKPANETALPQRFVDLAEDFAEALPDKVGSVVFVVAPKTIDDQEEWVRSVRFLAEQVRSRWLKFIVLDSHIEPVTADLDDHPGIATLSFHLGPEEIEAAAEQEVDDSDPEVRRTALSTIGMMAFGRKDYGKAEAVQRQALDQARTARDPLGIALALYNLGNTLLAADKAVEAVEVFANAADGCVYHELDQVSPMVYTNLGVALHRAEQPEQAFQSLRVARDMFRAQRNVPGEAHVCDTLALLYHAKENRDEAERAWRYALSLYDGITNPAMDKVRDAGRRDILSKLEHFGYASES